MATPSPKTIGDFLSHASGQGYKDEELQDVFFQQYPDMKEAVERGDVALSREMALTDWRPVPDAELLKEAQEAVGSMRATGLITEPVIDKGVDYANAPGTESELVGRQVQGLRKSKVPGVAKATESALKSFEESAAAASVLATQVGEWERKDRQEMKERQQKADEEERERRAKTVATFAQQAVEAKDVTDIVADVADTQARESRKARAYGSAYSRPPGPPKLPEEEVKRIEEAAKEVAATPDVLDLIGRVEA